MNTMPYKKCSALMETLDNMTDSSGVLLVRADLVERITKVWIEVLAASKITTNHNERFEQMFRLLEEKMKKVQQLHVFSLPTADLKYFAVDIFPAMEVLKLDLCPPSTIKGIYTMRNILTTLVITNSGITNLSRILAPFKKRVLRTLSPMIFPDTISNIPPQFLWSNLLTLKLSNCGISKLDESLHFFPSIEHLDLSHNTISHIIHLQDCIDLKYVNFSHNRIRVLSNFERVLGSVTVINLAHNEIESLDGIDRILSLEKLDVSFNRINDFGEIQVLCRLPNLEFIRLEGNPLALNSISNRHYRMNIFHAFIVDGMAMNSNRPFPVLDGVPLTAKEKQFFKRVLFRSTTDKEAAFSHFDAHLLSSTDVLLDQELGGEWGNIDYNSEGEEAEFGDIYAQEGGEIGDFSFASEDGNANTAPVRPRPGSSGGVGELSSPVGAVLQGSFSSLGPSDSHLTASNPRSARHSVATSGSGRYSPQPFLGIAGGVGSAGPRNARASVDGSHRTRSPMQGRQLSVNFRSSLSPQTFSPIHGINAASAATRQSMYGRATSMGGGGGDSRASFMSTSGGGGGPLSVSSPSKRLALRILQANNATKSNEASVLRVKRNAPIINAGAQELYPEMMQVEENMKILREKLHAEALVLAHERLLEKQKQEQMEREKQIRASTLMSAIDSSTSPGRSLESPARSYGSISKGQSGSLESKFNEEKSDTSNFPFPAVTASVDNDTGRRVGVDLSGDGRDTPRSFTPTSLLRGIDTRGTKTEESSAVPSPVGERTTGQQLRYSFSSESDVPTHTLSQNNSYSNLSVAGSYTASEMSAYERANAKGRGLLTINNPLALQRRGSATQQTENLSEMTADSPLPDYAGSDCGDDPRRSSFSQQPRLSLNSSSKLSYASIVASSPRNNSELRTASVDHRALGLATTTAATNATNASGGLPGSAIDSTSYEEVAGAPNTYVGDPDYKNLSVVENMDLYMKEQVFNVKRPSGISPYMRDSKIDADHVGIADINDADLSNIFIKTAHRYEKFITVFCEKIIDITATASTAMTVSDTAPSTPPRITMNRRDQLPKAEEEASAAQEESRYLVLTDTSLYLVRVDFPSQALFVEAPIPTVIRAHKLYSLCKCTIFFGFQRCILGFADEAQYKDLIYDTLASQAESTTTNSITNTTTTNTTNKENLTLSGEVVYYQYMILTREKVRTYPLITRINKAANLQRNVFIPIPLANVHIDNKDFQLVEKVMQCTLTLGGDHDIVHYQMAYQVWRKRPGVKLPRTIILTQSLLILCSEKLNQINIDLEIIDTAQLSEVQKICMDDNPLYVTFVLKSNALFSKTRKWRMCTDSRAMSTKLQEECRRACSDMGNPV